MKSIFVPATLFVSAAMLSFAQPKGVQLIEPSALKVLTDGQASNAKAQAAAVAPGSFQWGVGSLNSNITQMQPSSGRSRPGSLPLWSYNATTGFINYPGMIVGGSPAINSTAQVPVFLLPVAFHITQNGNTFNFDPTAPDDGCLGAGNTAWSLTNQSPLLNNANYNFGGHPVNNLQYEDAFLRAEFAAIAAPNYHLILTNTPLGKKLDVYIGGSPSTAAVVYGLAGTQCGTNIGSDLAGGTVTNPHAGIAVVNINILDSILQQVIKLLGFDPSQFPFFVMYNSVLAYNPENLNTCCVLGYHNAEGYPGQTYGIAEFEGRNQTVFEGTSDVSAMSHEFNEWVNDPNGVNPTPPWGNIGQVGGCQDNFEVGDPLSGTLMPPVLGGNGFTYHLQELAFFSWFFRTTPSIGLGGMYSGNGTFKGYSIACPPGGTN